jgi:DNA-binding transcriptional MerR regulator
MVCQAFPDVNARSHLSFNHHRMLAVDALDAVQRARLLADADAHGWSSARLTKERDRLLGRPEKVPLLTFDSKVEAVLESLPKSATGKVRKEIKRAMDDLRHDFEKEVHHVAQERVKEQRERLLRLEREAEEEKQRLRDLRQNLDGLMTEDEYRLIRGCLHPDRAPEDRRQTFAKAFDIFTRLERSVNRDMPEKLRKARGWS